MAGIHQATYATPRLDLGEAFMEYALDNTEFVGTQFYGAFPVSKKEGTFSKIIRESLLQPAARVKRAPKAAYERDGFESEDQAYACVERGHEIPLDEGDVQFYSSDFDAEMVAAKLAMWRVMYDQEQDLANLIFDGTTTYTTGNGRRTDVTTGWSTVTAEIIDNVQSAKEAVRARTGIMGDTLLIGAGVVPYLLSNNAIQAAMGNDTEKSIDAILGRLKAILGLRKILIGNAVYNSANKGLTFSKTDVWGAGWAAVAVTADAGDSLSKPCVGRSLFWTADTPTDSALIEEYIEPQTRSKVIRARSFADELEIDPNFQQLLDIAG